MTKDEAVAKLREVQAAIHEQFTEEGSHFVSPEERSMYYDSEGRLHQFTASLETAVMAVEHLFDEHERETA